MRLKKALSNELLQRRTSGYSIVQVLLGHSNLGHSNSGHSIFGTSFLKVCSCIDIEKWQD